MCVVVVVVVVVFNLDEMISLALSNSLRTGGGCGLESEEGWGDGKLGDGAARE
jgi:hypothetical protein